MKNVRLLMLGLMFIGLMVSCSKTDDQATNPVKGNDPAPMLKDGSFYQDIPLIAGQMWTVGFLRFENVCEGGDITGIRVIYDMTATDWVINDIHFDIGCDFADINVNPAGNPVPGAFAYSFIELGGVGFYQFVVPISEFPCWNCETGTTLYYAAHCTGYDMVTGQANSTWGQGSPFFKSKGGNWGMWSTFTFNCECPEPCGTYATHTAWGGNTIGPGSQWWRYYVNNGMEQDVYAGQHWLCATVIVTDNGDGTDHLTITLQNGWMLNDATNQSVKINNASTIPTKAPAPGQFPYKGTDLIWDLPTAPYYFIHLDVMICNDDGQFND
jgi:hypothetical protein